MSEERYKMPVSVQIMIFNKNNEILLSKRKSTGFCDGQYAFVGGHVERNEEVIDAAIREAKEEVGIDIKREKLLFKSVMNRNVNESLEYVDFTFVVRDWQGDIINMEPEKCSELIWCNKNNIPENTIDFVKYIINSEDTFIAWGW